MYDDAKYSIKQIINFCQKLDCVVLRRTKNDEFIRECGITSDEITSVIRTMKEIYFLGCDKDRDHPGYVYIFHRLVLEKYWCYIKLRIKTIDNNKIVVVISFHKEGEYD